MLSRSAAQSSANERLDLLEARENWNAWRKLRNFGSVLQIRDHGLLVSQGQLDLAARPPRAGQSDDEICAQDIDVIA